ncbi:MAG: N-acetylornithine carbamoyltransferase [Fimbriimonadaceae bacterium]|nr:MAG: N-acetylornithine carbamoyltransferase [Fimbriimonadaceae bacterium]
MNNFLSLRDLDREQVVELVRFARELKANPIGDRLAKKVIGLLFMNPSLRTLASFQSAIGQQGGTSVVIQPGAGSWSLEFSDGAVMDGEAVEHVREAIPVLASYCDALGIRSFADQKNLDVDLADERMKKLAGLTEKPVINMESASDHPCQALADWMTLDELGIPKDGKFVLSWAWHPKPLPYAVPRAALTMAAQRGMDITILCPKNYNLPDKMITEAKQLGAASIEHQHNQVTGLADAHILYCKSWCALQHYGKPIEEMENRAHLRDWCVQESWFKNAKKDAKFMHCLPVRRNVKVADEILDGPRSVVIQQAENRLHVQKSVLISLLGGGN